ncbi:hypothetical protein TL16_g05446 [Triparma laevis f. inornata]|uniref:Core Histone H2A/H2B/H3 domain-containing protein n=2 Tax=Triparma laevis TaxID=1534972 RepID=A0A9W7AX01_9STRA|nr:hypothetical protein TL16_g05446 [Triparma laevis f. inornata]GMH79872.1 hypothetical protein TrLO_g2720 [Triparma laevis f. longispina]
MSNTDNRTVSPLTQVLSDYQAANENMVTAIEPHANDWKSHILPLARIKKIMKSEDEIKPSMGQQKLMISSEGPIFFSKACEIFIGEVAIRAWMSTCEGKRRTVQKADVQSALNRSDMFDFLIDIVPRLTGKSPVEVGKGNGGETEFEGDSNEIPTVNPQHGMMLQAITHHLQQDQMSQQLDPNLAVMMSGFEGGGAAGVGSGGLASEEEQRILMMQWQAAATQNLQAEELKRKKADDDDE